LSLFQKRASTADIRHDSAQNAETQQQARMRNKRSSVRSLNEVWDRWGPGRWQQKGGETDGNVEMDGDPVRPTAGAEPGTSSAQDFMREYVACLDPYGYAAYNAAMQQQRFVEDPIEEEETPSDDGRDPDKASMTSTWSDDTRQNARLYIHAASDPDGFSVGG